MEATKQYLWHLFWPNSADEVLSTEKKDGIGTGRKVGADFRKEILKQF